MSASICHSDAENRSLNAWLFSSSSRLSAGIRRKRCSTGFRSSRRASGKLLNACICRVTMACFSGGRLLNVFHIWFSRARSAAGSLSYRSSRSRRLKEKIDRGDNFVLIDVREPHEYRICNIPGAQLIPLGEFPKRTGELDPAAEIVIHCRSGVRSAKACAVLRQAGFPHVRNVVGGILAWADKVDPSMPKY